MRIQAWYLLGPVTKFAKVGEDVNYEMAGVKLTVKRPSAEISSICVVKQDDVRNPFSACNFRLKISGLPTTQSLDTDWAAI